MFNIGMPELIVVFIVALLAFGPKRLPEVGRQIGKAIAAFKRATVDLRDAIEQEPSQEITDEAREQLGKSEEEKAQAKSK